jgi:hypothetical protein
MPHQIDPELDLAIADPRVGRADAEIAGRGDAGRPARGDFKSSYLKQM